MRRTILITTAIVLLAVPGFAQQALKLEIKDGRVNLDASAVPARQILAEWARIGGTKVVGAEKIAGSPLTLKLVNMSERQALDIILRNVAGYMAAPRLASALPGASGYDRILILPTSAAPAGGNASNANRMPSPPGPMMGTGRGVPPPRPPGMMPRPDANTESDADGPPEPGPDDPADTGVNQQPVFTFPQPQQPGNQVFQPVPQGGFGVPGQPGSQQPIMLQPNPNGQPTIYNFMPNQGAQPAQGGFGVIGAPTPGVVQQPVQPVAPGVQRPKPPG